MVSWIWVEQSKVDVSPPTGRIFLQLALFILVAVWSLQVGGQELSPRAYFITPVHSNAITLIGSFYTGGVDFNGTIPITGATGTYGIPIFSYYHSFGVLGRSANVSGVLPYAVGHFQGAVLGTQMQIYRSGLMDTSFRVSVNLKGAPAMSPVRFAKWKQTTLLGVSLKVIAPTGQYNGAKLVNWGINRWAFKPDFGYSQPRHSERMMGCNEGIHVNVKTGSTTCHSYRDPKVPLPLQRTIQVRRILQSSRL